MWKCTDKDDCRKKYASNNEDSNDEDSNYKDSSDEEFYNLMKFDKCQNCG